MSTPSGTEFVIGCVLVLLLVAIITAIGTLIIMGLWNLILVPIFSIVAIKWWQAMLILFAIGLVGSAFRGGSS